ncbi:MAG TPA: glycosyltransferase, partial [Patescibacteria group bacterium]|nr:glycosyltransferase [Patescibacteria group bacterium]
MATGQPNKILYLVTLSEWGGAQKYIFDLATNCQGQGLEVVVAAGGEKQGELLSLLTRSNIQSYYLPNLQREINFKKDWRAFFDIIKLIKKVGPTIIHLNSSKAGSLGALAAKLCGVKKIIYTVHGLVLNEPLSRRQRAFYWLSEWFSGQLKNKLICVSEFDRQSIIQHKLADPKKITVIHNGVDPTQLTFWSKSGARIKLAGITGQDFPDSDWLVGTIANF